MNQHKKPVILVPNVTSSANVGDAAMLQVLLDLLQSSFESPEIRVHASQPESYEFDFDRNIKPTLYHWAVFENQNVWVRIKRMLQVLLLLAGLTFDWRRMITLVRKYAVIDHILNDFEQADVVVFVGGGYLRSKPGLSQSLNLLMQLVPFYLGSKLGSATIVSPIGFGPFAYPWQEALVAKALARMKVVGIREPISWSVLQQYKPANAVLSHDHALLLQKVGNQKESKQEIVGFTIRSWLEEEQQTQLEQAYVDVIEYLVKQWGVLIQPIVQVDAKKYRDDDKEVTDRVMKQLRERGVEVEKLIVIHEVEQAQKVYGRLEMLIGMRMHSNIIAATQHVPFVAVAYEYKTQGIARDLGLEQLCVECMAIDKNNFRELVGETYAHKESWRKRLVEQLEKIQHAEEPLWQFLLKSWNT